MQGILFAGCTGYLICRVCRVSYLQDVWGILFAGCAGYHILQGVWEILFAGCASRFAGYQRSHLPVYMLVIVKLFVCLIAFQLFVGRPE